MKKTVSFLLFLLLLPVSCYAENINDHSCIKDQLQHCAEILFGEEITEDIPITEGSVSPLAGEKDGYAIMYHLSEDGEPDRHDIFAVWTCKENGQQEWRVSFAFSQEEDPSQTQQITDAEMTSGIINCLSKEESSKTKQLIYSENTIWSIPFARLLLDSSGNSAYTYLLTKESIAAVSGIYLVEIRYDAESGMFDMIRFIEILSTAEVNE